MVFCIVVTHTRTVIFCTLFTSERLSMYCTSQNKQYWNFKCCPYQNVVQFVFYAETDRMFNILLKGVLLRLIFKAVRRGSFFLIKGLTVLFFLLQVWQVSLQRFTVVCIRTPIVGLPFITFYLTLDYIPFPMSKTLTILKRNAQHHLSV